MIERISSKIFMQKLDNILKNRPYTIENEQHGVAVPLINISEDKKMLVITPLAGLHSTFGMCIIPIESVQDINGYLTEEMRIKKVLRICKRLDEIYSTFYVYHVDYIPFFPDAPILSVERNLELFIDASLLHIGDMICAFSLFEASARVNIVYSNLYFRGYYNVSEHTKKKKRFHYKIGEKHFSFTKMAIFSTKPIEVTADKGGIINESTY